MSSNKTLAILFSTLGPYHVARMLATERVLADTPWDAAAIEVSPISDTYPWEAREEPTFASTTLFPGRPGCRAGALAIARRTWAGLDKLAPDAVAIPGWQTAHALAACGWCRAKRRPAILMSDSKRDDMPRLWYKEAVKKAVIKGFSAALVAGKTHAAYAKSLGIPGDKCFLGYDVVDNRFFTEGSDAARGTNDVMRAQLKLPKRYFLACKRFVPKKNAVRLLDAYAIYRSQAGENPWGLVLLGDGPMREQLKAFCANKDIGGVSMPGFRQYEDLPAYYGLAGALVHASTVEQWGLVVNEGMAAGLPVIISRQTGCAGELVEEGRNGWTFDAVNSAELASLMLRMHTLDKAGRLSMGEASRRIIAAWGTERFAASMKEILDMICMKNS